MSTILQDPNFGYLEGFYLGIKIFYQLEYPKHQNSWIFLVGIMNGPTCTKLNKRVWYYDAFWKQNHSVSPGKNQNMYASPMPLNTVHLPSAIQGHTLNVKSITKGNSIQNFYFRIELNRKAMKLSPCHKNRWIYGG